jgi:hypothetical protein
LTTTTSTNSFGYADVTAVAGQAATADGLLQQAVSAVGATTDPTAAQLLAMQQAMQKWSLLVEAATSLSKSLSETLKSIVQKIS